MKRGFTQSRYDECFYFMKLFKGSRVNKLLVTMHVDDCEVAGCPSDLAWFKKVLVAEFGEVKEQQWDFRHCGIEYHQSNDLKEITHSQKQFIDAMEYYPMGKVRSKERQSPLDASEATGYRSVLGGLQWASHTRSDHSAECSRLQGKRGSPTVEDMRDANSLLRRCKDTASSAYLSFRKQSTAPKRILVFPDASLNSVSKKDTNGNKTEQKRTRAG